MPSVPVLVSSQWPLAPSVTSLANDGGDNEMIQGQCTDILEFALQLRKTSENLNVHEGVRTVIALNGVLSLQIRSVGSHSTSGMEKEGNDGVPSRETRIQSHNLLFINSVGIWDGAKELKQ